MNTLCLAAVVGLAMSLAQSNPSRAAIASSKSVAVPRPGGAALLETTIRVRLAEGATAVAVRGFDLRISDARSGTKAVAAPDRLSQWDFRCRGDRIRAIRRGGKALELRSPAVIRSPTGFLRAFDRPYRDSVVIYSAGMFCEVINEVDVEKYLDGLVNSEFSSKWSEEAIAAQVVAARTYALFQLRSARAVTPRAHFDVDATDKDQVYDGSLREDFRASRSVERTRGMVLTVGPDRSPEPLKAFYHSTCGGVTELPQNVWGKPRPGFKKIVQCPFCKSSPKFHWELQLDPAEIAQAFLKRGALSGPGGIDNGLEKRWPRDWMDIVRGSRLLGIRVDERDPSGRATRVSTVWWHRKALVDLSMSSNQFRSWLGAGRFRSTFFEVSHLTTTAGPAPGDGVWRFQGRGNGHGVGMCQWGAKVMGEKGFTMVSILKRYYPDAVLRRMW